MLDRLERYDIGRASIGWYSGPLDILRHLIQFGAYFTVGVEVSYSETIQAIAREIPDHLLLTETDNPGGLKWLKEIVGMPRHVQDVIDVTARVRSSAPESVARIVQENFLRMIEVDPWLKDWRPVLSQSEA